MRLSSGRTAVVCAVLAPLAFACSNVAPAAPPKPTELERARRVLGDAILFDGHNDLPWAIRTDKKAAGAA